MHNEKISCFRKCIFDLNYALSFPKQVILNNVNRKFYIPSVYSLIFYSLSWIATFSDEGQVGTSF